LSTTRDTVLLIILLAVLRKNIHFTIQLLYDNMEIV
jgi:hypothetical protein